LKTKSKNSERNINRCARIDWTGAVTSLEQYNSLSNKEADDVVKKKKKRKDMQVDSKTKLLDKTKKSSKSKSYESKSPVSVAETEVVKKSKKDYEVKARQRKKDLTFM
jgi:hypothetical protein